MRLWHKNLIEVLPSIVLLHLWKECCDISKRFGDLNEIQYFDGRNYVVISRVQFSTYCRMVHGELINRGWPCNISDVSKWLGEFEECKDNDIFSTWHNNAYLWRCYDALEEMLDYGEISKDDFARVLGYFSKEETCIAADDSH